MPTHRIKVLTFDADGTIWDFHATMRAALSASLDELRQHYPEAVGRLAVRDLLAHRQEAEVAFKGRSMTMEGLRFAGFVRTLDAIGIRDEQLAHKLTARYLERRFATARVFDDVFPTLDLLRRHYSIGLLTNGNSYPDRHGVGDRFNFAVVAQEHGVWKPETAFYQLAAAEAGCGPQEILHIGDSLENDVAPARRAGMHAVWLNRTGTDLPSGFQSVATLYSLDELPAFLGLIEN